MIREETIFLGSIIKIHALKGELLLATELNLEEIQIKTEWVFFDFQGQLVPFFVEYLSVTGSSMALLKVEEINSIDPSETEYISLAKYKWKLIKKYITGNS